jgi:hypothetical protein
LLVTLCMRVAAGGSALSAIGRVGCVACACGGWCSWGVAKTCATVCQCCLCLDGCVAACAGLFVCVVAGCNLRGSRLYPWRRQSAEQRSLQPRRLQPCETQSRRQISMCVQQSDSLHSHTCRGGLAACRFFMQTL